MATAAEILLDALKILFGAGAGAFIVKRVDGKPKLVAYWGHVSSFTMTALGTQQPLTINTHEVVLRNAGNKAATNVRISHAYLPDQFNIFPAVPYSIEDIPGGAKDLVIPTLVPEQQITIAYLYYPPITFAQINSGVRSNEGFAKSVEMELSEKTPKWGLVVAWIGFLIGVLTVIYFSWKGISTLL